MEVKCGQCGAALSAKHKAIKAHYLKEHKVKITPGICVGLISKAHREQNRSRRKIRLLSSSSTSPKDDRDFQHEMRWRGIIQGGAPGSGKRR